MRGPDGIRCRAPWGGRLTGHRFTPGREGRLTTWPTTDFRRSWTSGIRAEQAAKEELAGALHAMAACQAQLKRLEEDLARRKAD